MAKRFKLLLLDANVVIELFRQDIWEQVIAQCDVYLSRTVAEQEALFYEPEDAEKQYFDVLPYAEAGRITIFDVTACHVSRFRDRFDPSYAAKLDAGETESLIYLLDATDDALICSADGIVYRVLGNMLESDRGISLEEVLNRIGLSRSLDYQFTAAFREKCKGRGFGEHMRGIGRKE